MESFEFKIESLLLEKDFVELSKHKFKYSIWSILKLILLLTIGILLLFFSDTFSFGILFILLFIFIISIPFFTTGQSRKQYREQKDFYYGSEISINEKFVKVDSESIKLEIKWHYLKYWSIKNEYLKLSFIGTWPIFIEIDSLKQQKVYESILTIVKKHGMEYGSTGAMRSF